MMTVHEVSRLTGVSVRTLQYYDSIGLLTPTERSEAGYRLYDTENLEILQQILLYRELAFPLRDIREMLQSPSFDRNRALSQQIRLLEMRKEHLERLIAHARNFQETGGKQMDFSAFDTKKIDEYTAKAKATWGSTPAYREFEEKTRDRSKEEDLALGDQLMAIFAEFGREMRENRAAPADASVQRLVTRLQTFITEHYYTCTDQILMGLGEMYAAGGEMTENIDSRGGVGTGAFVREAIRVHCA